MRKKPTPEDSTGPEASGNLSLLLEDLSRLVRTESPSTDLDAVGRSARVVADLVHERLGRRPEILCVDGVDHVLLRGADPKVMLLGHHDTVWPLGTLDELPYTETAGVVSGPGCFDMKLGLVQAIHALAWLRRCRGTGVLDQVTLLITGDEELGSTTSRALIEQEAGRCRAALVLEAAGPGGALKTGRKGVSLYRIEVLGRAAHSGLDPEKGVNATIAIAEVVLAIAQLADPAASTTVTPTVMSAGTTPNTVPATATVAVDVRAGTAEEQHRVDRAIREVTPVLVPAEIRVRGGINRPPMERSAAAALFSQAQRIARRLGHPPLEEMTVGGASDGNFTAGMGVPTLDGLGAVGGGAHARDEHAEIAWILPRTRLLTTLIEELTGRSAGPQRRAEIT
ncbi:M20 family metallopeptidase [Nonomuraea aurantiaca]|uniref:M20 family metallopeptidase n=1 Tax=Nonomuraea aurantiaca TaxID=2878562 RepID=UPI001CD94773|nr:M20 family metallopeptidase [Nonomuraea aurantiaca]MCA2229287.1 M20 family metallopeptidase [Nonomuraea aurantiaca]